MTAADVGMYLEARDDTGIALDEEGPAFNPDPNFISLPLLVEVPSTTPTTPGTTPTTSPPPSTSSPTGPRDTNPAAPAGKFGVTLKTGPEVVTVVIKCPGPGACKGKVTVKFGKATLGSKSYSTPPGTQPRVKVKLGKAVRKLLESHPRLKATLTVDPAVGKALKKTVTLKAP